MLETPNTQMNELFAYRDIVTEESSPLHGVAEMAERVFDGVRPTNKPERIPMDPFVILGAVNGVLTVLNNGVHLAAQVLSLVLPFI
ncbi:hypothetical protein IU469_29940 [Nocardia puris]|nr:hypothetical protein [Nocardia puris]MBF6215498.1 hypothetical protein [Nocardia puris]MBF6369901.1 hypothetical protein [Nocardia puris]